MPTGAPSANWVGLTACKAVEVGPFDASLGELSRRGIVSDERPYGSVEWFRIRGDQSTPELWLLAVMRIYSDGSLYLFDGQGELVGSVDESGAVEEVWTNGAWPVRILFDACTGGGSGIRAWDRRAFELDNSGLREVFSVPIMTYITTGEAERIEAESAFALANGNMAVVSMRISLPSEEQTRPTAHDVTMTELKWNSTEGRFTEVSSSRAASIP